ncbi:MAG: tyrosine-protein phosphatase [Pseudomonadota bacterium]
MNAPPPPETAAYAAKMRRIARWQRPLVTPWDRLRAWTNMLFVDHGIFRLFYVNMHQISPRAWRSAQPFPHHIRRFAKAGGRTVISLRGGLTFGSLPLEREACEAQGLTFETFVLRSRALPDYEDLCAIEELFARLEYPVLFHCKSGADRAGFMAALFLVLAEGRPVAEAQRQLSPRFGHIRQGKTGVLDAFFDTYRADTGGDIPLMEWARTQYDRDAVMCAFKASGIGSLLTEKLLRRE